MEAQANARALTTQDQGPMTATEIKGQVQRVQEIMKAVMKGDEHYGTIPGTHKPTLLKPGAEKLAMTFRLAPAYEELSGCQEHKDFIFYKIRCNLSSIQTGKFVGSGLGACNSREKKYHSSSPWDIQNTLYKMACKRALVAAVLNATAASDIFTQDLEDMGTQDTNGQDLTEKQRQRLWVIMNKHGKTTDQLKAYLAAKKIQTVTRSNYDTVCDWAESDIEPIPEDDPAPFPVEGRQPGEEG